MAPHPSTLAAVLLAFDAWVEVAGGEDRSLEALLGSGRDPARENSLEEGALVTTVCLPAQRSSPAWGYRRATSRALAEWPYVEAYARLGMDRGRISWARVTLGAVATVPFRLAAVEALLLGQLPSPELLAAAAASATAGAAPLPGNAYKLRLIPGVVLDALEQAVGRSP